MTSGPSPKPRLLNVSAMFWALVLALAMLPGLVEILENGIHLLTEGHLAHEASAGDRHASDGPEHGCTPVLHLCGCHAGPAMTRPAATAPVVLHAVDNLGRQGPARLAAGFPRSLERPPQA